MQRKFREQHFSFSRKVRLRHHLATGIDSLGDSGTREPKDCKAVLRSPGRRNERMQFVLAFSPIGDVHRGDNEQLRAEFYQSIRDTRIAKIVADADSNFPPGRIPKRLLRRRKPILEKLDRYAFDLLENDFATRINDKGGVVEISTGRRVFSSDDQMTVVGPTPSREQLRDRSVQGIFAQHE